MNWYLAVLKKYAVFSGRARRKEYWMFALFYIIFAFIAIALDSVLRLSFDSLPFGFFYFAYIIAMIIPTLAVLVRRLHDTGKSGWMIFIQLIPIAGPIWLFILTITDSTPGENQYGSNPKDDTATTNETLDGHLA